MSQCTNVGELTVGGKVVGLLRCQLDAGHEAPVAVFDDGFGNEVEYSGNVDPGGTAPIRWDTTPHRATLDWSADGAGVALIDWPEANNPDERFDVDPMAEPVKALDGRAPCACPGDWQRTEHETYCPRFNDADLKR